MVVPIVIVYRGGNGWLRGSDLGCSGLGGGHLRGGGSAVVIVIPIIVPAVVMVVVKSVIPVVPYVVAPVVVGVVALSIHFQHLAGRGVDLVFVFDAVQDVFDFVGAVVNVVVLFHKLQVAASQLGGQNALGGLGVDIALLPIPVVVVVFVNGDGLCADLLGLQGGLGVGGNPFQKVVAGILGAVFQFQHQVFGLSLRGILEVTGGVDAADEFLHHIVGGLSLIAGVVGEHLGAVVVNAGQSQGVALVVVFQFNFRVDG